MEVTPLKVLRTMAGWTQDQLSEHVGLERSYLSRLETGERKIPDHQRERLYSVLARRSKFPEVARQLVKKAEVDARE